MEIHLNVKVENIYTCKNSCEHDLTKWSLPALATGPDTWQIVSSRSLVCLAF